MAYLTVQAAEVVPVDPFGGGQLDLGQGLPGPLGFDQFGLVEADRGFHQGVVVGVADRADGGGDAVAVQGSASLNDVYWEPASE